MGFKSEQRAYAFAAEVEMPGTPRSVLLALAHCRNERTGLCNPGQSTLVRLTGWSERTVRDALAWLVEREVIAGSRQRVGKGRGSGAMLWSLHIDQPAVGSDDQPAAPPDQPAVGSDQPAVGSVSGEVAPLIDLLNRNEPQTNGGVRVLDRFEEFWDAWPKRSEKPSALEAWSEAVGRADPHAIVAAAIAYRDNPGRPEPRFVPKPANWLRNDGWNDDLPVRARTSAELKQDANLAVLARYATPRGPLALGPGLTSDYAPEDSWMAFNR